MRKKLLLVFGIAFLFRLVLAFLVWHPDVWNHMDWGVRFFQYGAIGFFRPESNVWNYTWPNQPPGTIYIYAGIKIDFVFSIFWWVNVHVPIFPSIVMYFLEDNLYPAMLKLPSIISDLGTAYLIYLILGKRHGLKGAILYLYNPAIWYNSAVWGQTDSLISFVVFLSVWLLMKRRIALSIVLFIFSLYIKISLLIFLPVYALYIYIKHKEFERFEVLKGVGVGLGLVGLMTLPFSQGEPFSWLYWLYTKKVLTNQLQVITANAFNLWAGLTGIHEQSHTKIFLVFSYQTWGWILFLLCLLPMLYLLWKKRSDDVLLWVMAGTAFASFVLMTNMHERYLYPLFLYLTILAVRFRKIFWVFVSVSIINILNLYNFWWTPRIEPIIQIMSYGNRVLPRILGFVMFGIFVWFYRYLLTANRLDQIKRNI